jgi:hypothetical protein
MHLAPQHGGGPQHPPGDLGQPLEARGQYRLDGVGHRMTGGQGVLVSHGVGQFFQKQRIALRLGHQLCHQGVGVRSPWWDGAHHRDALGVGELRQGELRGIRFVHPG